MTDIIDRLTTPAKCEQLAKNVPKENPELAIRAPRHTAHCSRSHTARSPFCYLL